MVYVTVGDSFFFFEIGKSCIECHVDIGRWCAICLILIFGIPLILATYGMIFIAGFALAVMLEIMQYAFTGNS